MASRQEEKEARRQARLEQEAAERKAEGRRKRLQMVLGGVLALGIVVGIVLAVTAGGGGDGGSDDGPSTASASGVKLPEQQTSDLQEAVETAGCTVDTKPNEGNTHATKTFTAADYEQNPPTSGTHTPDWAEDGIYEPGGSPPLGKLVHTLEHGRINIQYPPGTSEQVLKQLEALVAENGGYHMLLYENTTEMDAKLAATAWDQQLTCPKVDAKTWDALRTFRDRYLDKGPETVP